jgi:hypothetical protein
MTRPNTIEFKWAGTPLPSVRIGPSATRKLDAFWLQHFPFGFDKTSFVFGLNVITDSSDYYPRIQIPGRYQIAFHVVSQNFLPASQSFILEVGSTLDSVMFKNDD